MSRRRILRGGAPATAIVLGASAAITALAAAATAGPGAVGDAGPLALAGDPAGAVVALESSEQPRRRGRRGGPEQDGGADAAGDDAAGDGAGDGDAEKPLVRDEEYLAITGGTVHTVSGGVHHGVTILCRDGRIIDVGPRVRIPEGATVVDATGHHVYPGLVAVQSSRLVGGGNPADSTDPFSFTMTLGLAGGITTAITGNDAAKLTFGTLDDHVLERDLWQTIRYDTRNPRGRARLREALEQAREHLRERARYELERRVNPDAEEPGRLRGRAAEVLPLLTGEARALISANDVHEILQACELAEEYGIEIVILGGLEAWTVADRLGRAGISVILRPRQSREPDESLMRDNGSTIQNAAILHEHGVPVAVTPAGSLFGSGSGISLGGLAGRDNQHLPMAAAFTVRGGLSNAAAIRTITLDAARILGIDDRVGSIDVGKDADFAITDGDLLHYMTHVRWTIVNGRIVYDKSEDTLFSHIRPADDSATAEPDDYWPRRLGDGP